MTAAAPSRIGSRTPAAGRLLHNVVALYGVQIGRKVIPLLTAPYLAHVLGAAGWGQVAFVTALSEFVVILIEFGFNISATREIARHRDSPLKCGEIMAGVIGAQILLAALGASLAIGVSQYLPILAHNRALLIGGLFYGVMQGAAPLWFFQGLERMRLSSALEISGKTAALCGLFLFVHKPSDAWKVMALAGIAPALTTMACFLLAYRTIPLQRPRIPLVVDALQMGWRMFVFRSAESLYGVANVFLLGLFAAPEIVGYFAFAEKLSKAAFGLLNPIRDAIFPRLSHLAIQGRDAASRLLKTGAVVMIGGGFILGCVLFVSAPLITKLLLGQQFVPGIAALRILAALPLLLSITYSIGFQCLLPFGKDNIVNRIILSAGLLNVGMSFLLAPRFAHVGMAWTVVISEAFVSICMVLAVIRVQRESRPLLVLEPASGCDELWAAQERC